MTIDRPTLECHGSTTTGLKMMRWNLKSMLAGLFASTDSESMAGLAHAFSNKQGR